MRTLLGVFGLAAIAFVVRVAMRPCCEWSPRPAEAANMAEPVASRAAPLPASGSLARTEPVETAAAPDATALLLPDGSRVPALNGARSPQPMREVWPVSVPWSPITGVEHSPAGIDWFVHADGSRSTTQMVWRADLGRMDAMTRLARPMPRTPLPVAAKH